MRGVARMLTRSGTPDAPARSDASRNREHLLGTARRLVDELGVTGLSMDVLAAEAGLGKGTVFRRFGSRAGLFTALLDEYEREFQAACLSGPPPLGPGADPVDRLIAFGHERLRFTAERGHLLREANARPTTVNPASGFSRLHLRVLLQALDAGGDVEVLAFQLHAALEVPLHFHLDGHLDGVPPLTAERFAAGWTDLVLRVARR